MKTTPTITSKQLAILTLTYRFRFITTTHVQYQLGLLTTWAAQKSLNLLTDHDYLGRNYTGRDSLTGRPASYYLLPKGVATLKQYKPGVDHKVLHNSYRDKSASDDFIAHCRMVGDININLSQRYGEQVTLFTGSELARYDYMPRPLPDAYVEFRTNDQTDDEPVTFLLEVCDDSSLLFVYRKRLQQYTEYFQGGDWEAATNSEFPAIVMICTTEVLQQKLAKLIEHELESAYEDNLIITATTIASLNLPLETLRT